jgi:hypothetical protein
MGYNAELLATCFHAGFLLGLSSAPKMEVTCFPGRTLCYFFVCLHKYKELYSRIM